MNIHTVEKGESLYNIARRYSVPATKILQDNDLSGDRILTGDELLILTPTKTVTVRGGDTLDSISKKYNIKKRALLAQNPSLFGKGRLIPGQIITVKQDNAYLGSGSAIGIIKKGCNRENLTRCMPYITYLTVMAGVIRDYEARLSYGADWVREIPSAEEKVRLLGLCDVSLGKFLSDKEGQRRIISDMIALATHGGYSGIHISAKEAALSYPERFLEFLLETRKSFIGCDLILFTDVFEGTTPDASELSDGAVLHLNDYDINKTKNELKALKKN